MCHEFYSGDREQLDFSVNVIGQERLPELTPEEETKVYSMIVFLLFSCHIF